MSASHSHLHRSLSLARGQVASSRLLPRCQPNDRSVKGVAFRIHVPYFPDEKRWIAYGQVSVEARSATVTVQPGLGF